MAELDIGSSDIHHLIEKVTNPLEAELTVSLRNVATVMILWCFQGE
jgi:hypothetical protein